MNLIGFLAIKAIKRAKKRLGYEFVTRGPFQNRSQNGKHPHFLTLCHPY